MTTIRFQSPRRVFLLAAISLVFSLASAFGDGFIMVPNPHQPVSLPGSAFPLEVKYHRVTVAIKDRTALTSIDQAFYNPQGRALEGEYIFPVPRGAVINNFSMYIDGRETKAEMLDAAKARKIYEDIVRQARDPALLEYQGAALFRVRIFPIEPRKEKRVKISYSEILQKEGSLVEYVYPLNTEKFSAAPLDDVSIAVTIEAQGKIKNVFSTTHSIDTVYQGDRRAHTSWEARRVKPDSDFKLYYNLAQGEFGVSLIAHRVKGEDGFFFLDLSPGFWDSSRERVAKDVVFVLDVSGSMAGDKLLKAKGALLRCLGLLSAQDRFALVRFSTEAEALFDRLEPADATHLGRAGEFVKNLAAVGGTNIEDALRQALALSRGAADGRRPSLIVFITDGKPTIGETNPDRLVALVKKADAARTRIFTVGIDYSLDTILLDKLTTATRAYRAYVTPQEDIEAKIAAFYQKLDAPVLTDIRLELSGGVKLSAVQPRLNELPDLFLGSSLTLLGRYRGAGQARLVVKGVAANRETTLTYDLVFPEEERDHDNLPPLWAARRIGFLLEEMRLSGESREVIEEIIALARTYGIITPYTSYLVLEDEERRVRGNTLSERDQTLRNVAPDTAGFTNKSRQHFESFKEDSGTGGVTASGEVQDLRTAQANDTARKSAPRVNFTDEAGRTVDVLAQIRQVKGRAFYNSGREWNDSHIQNQKARRTNRIQFASAGYWKLLSDRPESAEYLALGKNVRFMLDGDLYEVFE